MNTMNLDQKMRLALWPIITVLFINTFGMLWYVLSGFDIVLESYYSMALPLGLVFRLVLLLVSLVFGFFVYDQQKKRMAKEYTPKGQYNMRGRGVIGFIMHVLIGLAEATFAFFTLNTFWFIANFTAGPISLLMQEVYWTGFGIIFVLAAYFLTRQTGLAFLAFGRRA